ncbi:MAG: hypothetical protein AAFX09_08650 [Pseudomonadota bacterium]
MHIYLATPANGFERIDADRALAVHLQDKLPMWDSEQLIDTVEHTQGACLAFDRYDNLVAASRAARSGKHGWFSAHGLKPQARRDFRNQLSVMSTDLKRFGQSLCHVPDGDSQDLLLVRFWLSECGCRVASVPECRWPSHLDRLLERGFGLTPAEVEIMRGVFEHSSIEALAEFRRRTVRTVRTQLSAIYAKTGLRSQADIVRFVAKLSN